jgi:hypothetical protein
MMFAYVAAQGSLAAIMGHCCVPTLTEGLPRLRQQLLLPVCVRCRVGCIYMRLTATCVAHECSPKLGP